MIRWMMSKMKRLNLYSAPVCRVLDVDTDRNFLASGDFGDGGYPGKDLDLGDEYDF